MEELLEVGQELRLNPYVAQMEKLSDSLKYLTKIFRENVDSEEEYRIEEYHVGMIHNHIKEKLCNVCVESKNCKMNASDSMQQFIQEIFLDLEEYGAELSVSKKRELEKKCCRFDVLKEEVLRSIWTIKNNRIWEARMIQTQDASIKAMHAFVNAVEESTKEIDASLFRDERLEKKIGASLKRIGVRTLKVALFVSKGGKYEIQLSAKAKDGEYVTTNDMAKYISQALGREFIPDKKERFVLKTQYNTIVFIEKPKYQILSSVCQRKKQESQISGDNFLIMEVQGGKVYVLISDGMGSGKRAYKKSRMLLELAEKLLESSIAPRLMIQMMNAALITEVREVEFATLDFCVVDLYRGEIELIKAGASATYIITADACKCFQASSLPMGVMTDSECNHYSYVVEEDCYVVMVTDGVNEAIQDSEKTNFIQKTFLEAGTRNTKELATILLEKVLNLQEGIVKDDMMVLVFGVWELQF